MPIIRPTYEELLERVFRIFETYGFSPRPESSAIGAIARVIALELSSYYDLLQVIEDQNNLDTATGASLDRIGGMFGIYRRPATRASSVGSASAVKLTNNSTSAVIVPAGTSIWPSVNPGKLYRTVETVNIEPGGEAFVHVVADGYGPTYHVEARELDSIEIDGISVTNPAPIYNSDDAEDDESFRARIANAFQRRYYGSEEAIRSALEEIPGVLQVSLISGARGPGTLDVIVVPTQVPASSDLVALLNERIRAEVVPGIDARLVLPRVVPVDVQLRITWKPRGRRVSTQEIVQAVRALIDTSPLEDGTGSAALYVSEIVQRVMDLSPGIADVSVDVWADGVPVEGMVQLQLHEVMRSRHVEVL